ncbi:MAG: phosphoribosylaminoimidazolesuccinocarboxamide synthase [Alphaproteobacteria bacterium]|nr:phosphoribosylaminoimidazolesuccinocarboxamide synthase [Alphaproteobacteria bacterium]
MTHETPPYHDLIRARLRDVLTDAHYDQLPGFGRGKVRDHYDLGDGRIIMIATDRQSAFDQILASVPFKGQVLTDTARFWFDATKDVVANHVIEYPDPNVMVVRKMDMVPVEVVVRDYLTGSTSTSVWTMYEKGERTLYGVDFPDGMKKNEKLPVTLLTPTTKGAIGAHDVPITGDEIVAQGLMTEAKWQELAQTALALFARGREIAAKRGLILVDTKYEFGYDENGKLTLADEIHTPDSSRYWKADSYEARLAEGKEPESLDKEFLRLWIARHCDPYNDPIPDIPEETLIEFSGKYIALFETISGRKFQPPPPLPSIRDRIWENLKRFV